MSRAEDHGKRSLLSAYLSTGGFHSCFTWRYALLQAVRTFEQSTSKEKATHGEGHMSLTFFFHEYGRRVGMVPRSSLKEGKNRQMVEKGTKTPNQPKPNTQARRPKLHHLVVFPLH